MGGSGKKVWRAWFGGDTQSFGQASLLQGGTFLYFLCHQQGKTSRAQMGEGSLGLQGLT